MIPIKRFVSFLLVFVLAVGLVADLAPRGKAVAPLALAQAALASYVASTGYKIWVDNGTGSDVLALVSDLYDIWLNDISGEMPMTLEQFATGNYVFTDNSGNIILSKTAADTFQSFSEWLKTNYNITPGASSPTSVIVPSSGGFQFPSYQDSGNVTITSLVDIYSLLNYVYQDARAVNYSSAAKSTLDSYMSNYAGGAIAVSVNTGRDYGGAGTLIISFKHCSVGDTTNAQQGNAYLRSVTSSASAGSPLNVTSFQEFSTNSAFFVGYQDVNDRKYYSSINASSLASGAGLALGLAQDVIDKAAGLTDGKSLVIDVGAVAGDTADEIVDAVIAGYDTATGTLPVTDSVVDTAVIDTPVQPYPDVDSLGLPELGLALTTRFPFSIPWDIGAIYGALSHSEVPPVKTFDLIPPSVLARWGVNASVSITLDFTQEKYQVLFAIVHWACIIGFCLGLATLTKRYIWTTGG